MGAADIARIEKLFPQAPAAAAGNMSKTKDTRDDFSQMMNRMTGWAGSKMPAQSQTADPGSRQPAESVDTYDRYQYRESPIREKETTVSQTDDQVTSKLEEYAEDVKEVLKEELGVSGEQIEEAMETLGLTFIDLMDPAKLAGLSAELTGISDVGDLLCSDAFTTVIQEAGILGRELLEELGITLEELKALVEVQKVSISEEGAFQEIFSAETAEAVAEPEHEELPEDTVRAVAEGTDRSAEYPEEMLEKNESAEADTDEHVIQVKEDVPENETRQGGEKESASGQESRNPVRTANHNQPTGQISDAVFGQNMGETLTVYDPDAATGVPDQVDVASIIRQISEFTKVNAGNDVTTLQMQLNPEHLGKLYLELSAREGNVSARIMAQNETVKEVLEAQIVELRESMNEAGVKVEAIEVTVASHAFERNLEQNAGRDERQAEEQEKAAKRTRRIRLDDLDGLSGVMSEEESLVAQMMADQGNSVDFTA